MQIHNIIQAFNIYQADWHLLGGIVYFGLRIPTTLSVHILTEASPPVYLLFNLFLYCLRFFKVHAIIFSSVWDVFTESVISNSLSARNKSLGNNADINIH